MTSSSLVDGSQCIKEACCFHFWEFRSSIVRQNDCNNRGDYTASRPKHHNTLGVQNRFWHTIANKVLLALDRGDGQILTSLWFESCGRYEGQQVHIWFSWKLPLPQSVLDHGIPHHSQRVIRLLHNTAESILILSTPLHLLIEGLFHCSKYLL